MPEFAWRAADLHGRMSEGRQDAPTEAVVARGLRAKGLVPLSVVTTVHSNAETLKTPPQPTVLSAGGPLSRLRPKNGPVTRPEILTLTTELSIMLRAGLSLASALRVLIDMSQREPISRLLMRILDDVKDGLPLSRALEREPSIFDPFYLNMVRSGEASGQLASVLARLVEHLERLRALRESVVSASIYPAILLGVSILSLIAMLGFVVPQFEKLFTDMGDALPLPTRWVMTLGHVFRDGWPFLLIGGIGAFWFLRRWFRSVSGRAWWQQRALQLPLLGPLARKYQLNLFARTLGTLLGNGVPLVAAVSIANDTMGNRHLQHALGSVIPDIKAGRRLVDAFSSTGIFEPLAINLVRVGEETGRIGSMMLELSTILDREVEIGIKRALTFLEPVLIVVLGLMIAAIIVSILLGILSINDLAV